MKSEELLKVLEDLEEESFQKFKWHLEEGKIPDGHNGIPKSKLEKAEMQEVVDLMVQNYALCVAVQLTKKILEKIPRMDLVERLPSETKDSQNQASQSPTNQQTDGKAPAPSEYDGDSGSSSSQASQPPTPSALSPTSPLKAPDLNFHTLSDDSQRRPETLRSSGSPFSNISSPSVASALSPTSPLKAPDLNFQHTATKLLSDDSQRRPETLRSSGSPFSNISSPSVASGLCSNSLLKASDMNFQSIKTKLLSDDPLLGLDTLSLSDSPFEKLSGTSLTSGFNSRHLLREQKLSFNHPGALGSNLLSAGLDHSHFGPNGLRLKQSGEQKLPSGVMKYTRELAVDENPTGSSFKMSYNTSTVTTSHHSSSFPDPFDRHFSSIMHRKF